MRPSTRRARGEVLQSGTTGSRAQRRRITPIERSFSRHSYIDVASGQLRDHPSRTRLWRAADVVFHCKLGICRMRRGGVMNGQPLILPVQPAAGTAILDLLSTHHVTLTWRRAAAWLGVIQGPRRTDRTLAVVHGFAHRPSRDRRPRKYCWKIRRASAFGSSTVGIDREDAEW